MRSLTSTRLYASVATSTARLLRACLVFLNTTFPSSYRAPLPGISVGGRRSAAEDRSTPLANPLTPSNPPQTIQTLN